MKNYAAYAKSKAEKPVQTEKVEAKEEVNPVKEEEKVEEPVKKSELPKMAYVVNCSELNVRKFAAKSSDVETTIKEAAQVRILGKEGDFTKVQLADGLTGYCMTKYLKEV